MSLIFRQSFAVLAPNTYWDWYSRHIFLFGKAATYVTQFAQTFQEFPQRQKHGKS